MLRPLLALALLACAPPAPADEVLPPSGVRFETRKLSLLPAYRPRLVGGEVETLARRDLVAELRIATGIRLNERGADPLPAPLPRVSCRFEAYSAVDHAWMRELVAWFRKEAEHLHLDFRPESWDCDDFSKSLNAFADLAQLGSPTVDAPRLIGRLVVEQRHPWAGTPAGGTHEVIVFRSEKAWWVCEPQSGEMVSLLLYPNRAHVREILLN